MSLLKDLWNKLIIKTSTSPKLAVVEEECCDDEHCETSSGVEAENHCEDGPCKDVLIDALRSHGLSSREIRSLRKRGVEQDFENWYDGPCNRSAIAKVVPAFLQTYENN